MDDLLTPSNFSFSAVSLDQLGASEYTLATILIDCSASVFSFRKELVDCLKTIVKSCEKSPRSENLMLRVVKFNNDVSEIHGFKLLSNIDLGDYDNNVICSGATSCFDAISNAIESTNEYAKILQSQDFICNGVVYVITDGEDNSSFSTLHKIKDKIDAVHKDEYLDSFDIIVVGVGNSDISSYLKNIKDTLGLNQFISLVELFKKTSPDQALAKLAGWVSKSISITSQAIGKCQSNSLSLPLTF